MLFDQVNFTSQLCTISLSARATCETTTRESSSSGHGCDKHILDSQKAPLCPLNSKAHSRPALPHRRHLFSHMQWAKYAVCILCSQLVSHCLLVLVHRTAELFACLQQRGTTRMFAISTRVCNVCIHKTLVLNPQWQIPAQARFLKSHLLGNEKLILCGSASSNIKLQLMQCKILLHVTLCNKNSLCQPTPLRLLVPDHVCTYSHRHCFSWWQLTTYLKAVMPRMLLKNPQHPVSEE